jgi:hypothetical protein
MNISYLIYQAERPRTVAVQRAIDRSAGELAASLARRWHALTRLGQGHLLRRRDHLTTRDQGRSTASAPLT